MPENNYKEWIEKSRDNLNWARDNLKLNNYPLVCYLSHQAVELALKGLIYSRNKIPPKTHQLIRLAGICKGLKLNLDNFLPKLAILSEYYFESRYPNSLNKELDNKEIAEHALESAKKIVKKVLEYFDDKQKGGGYG